MKLPVNKLSHSFTLIELLMVVSIITILAGATIPSFTGYLKGQTLKNAKEQFKNDLRSIQNKSLTGSLSDQNIVGGGVNSPGSPVRYWIVKFWFGQNYYRTYAVYDFMINGANRSLVSACANLSNSGASANDTRPQGIYYLPSGVTFGGGAGGFDCLIFRMSDGALQNRTGSFSGTISLVQGSDTKNISWNYAGKIGN
jgi:prepilin-type N-terminal cleavage/methylation domain-containing protein